MEDATKAREMAEFVARNRIENLIKAATYDGKLSVEIYSYNLAITEAHLKNLIDKGYQVIQYSSSKLLVKW